MLHILFQVELIIPYVPDVDVVKANQPAQSVRVGANLLPRDESRVIERAVPLRVVFRKPSEVKARIRNMMLAGFMIDDQDLLRAALIILQDLGVLCTAMASGQELTLSVCENYDILFIGSLQACRVIRGCGYRGFLVLVSGSVTYMDDNIAANCDFVLSIPYTPPDIHRIYASLIASVHDGQSSKSAEISSGVHQQGNSDPSYSLFSLLQTVIPAIPTVRLLHTVWGNEGNGLDFDSPDSDGSDKWTSSLGQRYNFAHTRFFLPLFTPDVEGTV